MSIPGIDETQSNVPPPLPPPRYLPGTEPANLPPDMRGKRDFGPNTASFASGYGSMASSFAEERPSYLRRDMGSFNGDRDEGYSSYSTDRYESPYSPVTAPRPQASPGQLSWTKSANNVGFHRSRESLRSEFGLHHNHFQFQSPAVDSMKKKLDPVRMLDKSPPRSLLSASVNELLPRRPTAESRFPPALSVPVQLPIHTRNILGSPARFTETPLHSAISPRSAPFHYGDRSPNDGSDIDRSPRTRTRRNNSDDATSTQGSYDFNGAEEMEMEETSLKRLHIDDAYLAGGQKRRAASPPDEHISAAQMELARRSRGSPQPRLTTIPQGTTIPSVPSTSRSNSYMSTMSVPTTITTANSFGRRSPGLSPGGISPTSCNSPYTTPISLNPSPRNSISGRSAMHARTVSSASSRKMGEAQKSGGPKLQEFFMCDCCPKKPKRFETAEELK